MTKEEMLKPRLIEAVDRLRKFIDLNAPGVIIGAEAAHVFAAVLAVYGNGAGSTFLGNIRDRNLHDRGVCGHEDCTNYVERPGVGICGDCQKELGLDEICEVGEA